MGSRARKLCKWLDFKKPQCCVCVHACVTWVHACMCMGVCLHVCMRRWKKNPDQAQFTVPSTTCSLLLGDMGDWAGWTQGLTQARAELMLFEQSPRAPQAIHWVPLGGWVVPGGSGGSDPGVSGGWAGPCCGGGSAEGEAGWGCDL